MENYQEMIANSDILYYYIPMRSSIMAEFAEKSILPCEVEGKGDYCS